MPSNDTSGAHAKFTNTALARRQRLERNRSVHTTDQEQQRYQECWVIAVVASPAAKFGCEGRSWRRKRIIFKYDKQTVMLVAADIGEGANRRRREGATAKRGRSDEKKEQVVKERRGEGAKR